MKVINRVKIFKFSPYTHTHAHTHCESIDVLTNIMATILQYIHVSNHYTVYFKLIQSSMSTVSQ